MAPAMTLKRMYHWVPSNINAMEPTPRPPPMRIRPSIKTGKSAVAGTEATTWVMGWRYLASLGLKPMVTPAGIVHRAAMAMDVLTRR